MILATSPIFSLIDDILLVIPLIKLLMIFLPASNNFGPIPVIMLGISPILFDTAVFASSNFSLIVLLASSNLFLTVCTISCPFLIASFFFLLNLSFKYYFFFFYLFFI